MSPSRVPENGSRGFIVPIGGRIGESDILAHFLHLCGGTRANIAIIPTASCDTDSGEYYQQHFKALGAKVVTALAIEERADCEREEVLAALERADGVFLTGGTQLRLSTTLGGTSVAKFLRRRNANGQHAAGTSAGAAFLSEHMIAFGEEGPTPRQGMVTLAPGLGLTNRIVV